MDIFLRITVIAGLVYCVNSQSKHLVCKADQFDCTQAFYDALLKAIEDDPKSVRGDPNFGCREADDYRKCLGRVEDTGCPRMDESKYRKIVTRSKQVKLDDCWKTPSPTPSTASFTNVSVISTTILSALAIYFLK